MTSKSDYDLETYHRSTFLVEKEKSSSEWNIYDWPPIFFGFLRALQSLLPFIYALLKKKVKILW